MQLCYIHFYQKIARKKVARVNAALPIFLFTDSLEQGQIFFDNMLNIAKENLKICGNMTFGILKC